MVFQDKSFYIYEVWNFGKNNVIVFINDSL